jgi:hypothetical protein
MYHLGKWRARKSNERSQRAKEKQHKKEMVSWSDGMLGWMFNGLFPPNDKDY